MGARDLACLQVFFILLKGKSDRLNTVSDRLFFLNTHIKKIMQKTFGVTFDNILAALDLDGDQKIETLQEMRQLNFSDVMYPSADPVRYYEEITDSAKLTECMMEQLEEYNILEDKPMPIVLFGFAIDHCLVISRILKQPGGNALLVGVGGSGRQSLTRLAAKIGGMRTFSIELTKSYDMEAWHEDIKGVLKSAGGSGLPTVF
jgi:dynein heavy chain